jgi:hypothetical protein
MSGNYQLATEVQSAVTTQFENVEIGNVKTQDDGTVAFEVRISGDDNSTTHNDTDTGESEDTQPDKNFDVTPSDTIQERADEGDDGESDSQDSAVQKKKSESGKTLYKVGDDWMTYNAMQSTVKASNRSFPSPKTAENMVEACESLTTPASGGSENEDNESDKTADTDDVSKEFLIENGVEKEDVETVMKYREYNGVCGAEGCEYGANKGADLCREHQESDSHGNQSESNAEKVQQITNYFGVDSTTAREAIEAVDNDLVETVKEYIEG